MTEGTGGETERDARHQASKARRRRGHRPTMPKVEKKDETETKDDGEEAPAWFKAVAEDKGGARRSTRPGQAGRRHGR
jgi:hypothetical protein